MGRGDQVTEDLGRKLTKDADGYTQRYTHGGVMTLKELRSYKEELERALRCLENSHQPQVRKTVARHFQQVFGRLILKIQEVEFD